MSTIFAFAELLALFATIFAIFEFGPAILGRMIDRVGDWLAGIEPTSVAPAPSTVRKVAR